MKLCEGKAAVWWMPMDKASCRSMTRAEIWLDRAREACNAARELGGSGIQLVSAERDAWGEIEREREWHKHISEVI